MLVLHNKRSSNMGTQESKEREVAGEDEKLCQTQCRQNYMRKCKAWHLAGAIVGGLLLVVIGCAIGRATLLGSEHRAINEMRVGSLNSGMSGAGEQMRRGTMNGREAANPTDGVQRTRLSGVVTLVNGSDFLIAGNGTKKTIKTTSSTQYVGKTKVEANDSVMILGSEQGGNFVASTVRILNR
jgi:hypothetical protein